MNKQQQPYVFLPFMECLLLKYFITYFYAYYAQLFQGQEKLFNILYGTLSSICSICFIAMNICLRYVRLISGKVHSVISPFTKMAYFRWVENELYLENATLCSNDAYREHSTRYRA